MRSFGGSKIQNLESAKVMNVYELIWSRLSGQINLATTVVPASYIFASHYKRFQNEIKFGLPEPCLNRYGDIIISKIVRRRDGLLGTVLSVSDDCFSSDHTRPCLKLLRQTASFGKWQSSQECSRVINCQTSKYIQHQSKNKPYIKERLISY